jgi:hypothetical protein
MNDRYIVEWFGRFYGPFSSQQAAALFVPLDRGDNPLAHGHVHVLHDADADNANRQGQSIARTHGGQDQYSPMQFQSGGGPPMREMLMLGQSSQLPLTPGEEQERATFPNGRPT